MIPTTNLILTLEDTGSYIGDTDLNGNRNGKGVCTWMDGTTYDGYWKDNKRDG